MTLIEQLQCEPYRFDSGQALRILTAWGLAQAPTYAPSVRFRSSFGLTFPTSDIEAVDISVPGQPEMVASFMGLGGALGPLPVRYTEFINDSVRFDEPAVRDFLDIFNGRLVHTALTQQQLFRPVLQEGRVQDSNLAAQIYALLGLGTPQITDTIPRLAPALLPLAALVHQRPISAHAIERAVTASFEVAARVRPFRGAWLTIPKAQRTRLGAGGANRRLGRDSVLGRRAWDPGAGIQIVLGPMTYERALAFLPGAVDHVAMAGLVDFMLDGQLDVTLRLKVEQATAPASRLSPQRQMRLGWTSWLKAGDVFEGAASDSPSSGARLAPAQTQFRLAASGPASHVEPEKRAREARP